MKKEDEKRLKRKREVSDLSNKARQLIAESYVDDLFGRNQIADTKLNDKIEIISNISDDKTEIEHQIIQ